MTNSQQSTPSQQAKSIGLKSLSEVSEITGTSPQTLANWHKNKPDLFNVVLVGCRNIMINEAVRDTERFLKKIDLI